MQFLPLQKIGAPNVGIDRTVLLAALAASVGTAFVFGIAPALRGARANPTDDLRARSRAATEADSAWLRHALIVGQLAMSVVLLVGSGLLLRSLVELRRVDIGFKADNLLTAEIEVPSSSYPGPQQQTAFFESLTEELRAHPEIVDVGAISLLPIREPRNSTSVYAAHAPPATSADDDFAFIRSVLPGYFNAMNIPLLAGRAIEDLDRGDAAPVMVINQTMARRLFPDRSPLSGSVVVNFIGVGPAEVRVVGVVGDVRIRGLGEEPSSVFYLPYAQAPRPPCKSRCALPGSPSPSRHFSEAS